jgi:hypothetical protein
LKLLHSWHYSPQLVSKNWDLLPQKLIRLNSRYGLAFWSNNQQSQTSLQLFNCRGNSLGSFELSIYLDLITPNLAFSDRIFALDSHHTKTGLLINLKPFQVTRIDLPINPTFAIAQRENFILCDRKGTIVILSSENLTMRQCQLSLAESEQVTAIACTVQSELLVATWSGSQGTLYHLQSYKLGSED